MEMDDNSIVGDILKPIPKERQKQRVSAATEKEIEHHRLLVTYLKVKTINNYLNSCFD